MLAYYAARAPVYEEIYARPERQAELAALHAELATLFRDRVVLEPACGTGHWTRTLAEVARFVHAFDGAEATLDVARAKGLGSGNVRLARGDAMALDTLPPGADAALVAFWWSHVPRKELSAWLGRLVAALAPGAVVVAIDNRWVPGSSTPLHHADADGDTWQRRTVAGRTMDGSVHLVRKNFLDEAELRAVTAAWLRDVRVDGGPHFWRMVGYVPTRAEGPPTRAEGPLARGSDTGTP